MSVGCGVAGKSRLPLAHTFSRSNFGRNSKFWSEQRIVLTTKIHRQKSYFQGKLLSRLLSRTLNVPNLICIYSFCCDLHEKPAGLKPAGRPLIQKTESDHPIQGARRFKQSRSGQQGPLPQRTLTCATRHHVRWWGLKRKHSRVSSVRQLYQG